MERDHAPRRKPIPPIVPPSIPAANPGETLNYQTPPLKRKPWPRRAWNWTRYHLEDRVGTAFTWVIFVILVLIVLRPVTTLRLFLYFFGGGRDGMP
jgi:hypothetical protein